MVEHEPAHRFGLLGGEADAGADLEGEFGAELGVVAAAALGGVVQQDGGIERTPGLQVFHQPAGDGRDLRQLAAGELVEHADGLDGVLVDGEHVVGVELPLPDDAGPIGDVAAEEAGFVQHGHPAGAVGMVVFDAG